MWRAEALQRTETTRWMSQLGVTPNFLRGGNPQLVARLFLLPQSVCCIVKNELYVSRKNNKTLRFPEFGPMVHFVIQQRYCFRTLIEPSTRSNQLCQRIIIRATLFNCIFTFEGRAANVEHIV